MKLEIETTHTDYRIREQNKRNPGCRLYLENNGTLRQENKFNSLPKEKKLPCFDSEQMSAENSPLFILERG